MNPIQRTVLLLSTSAALVAGAGGLAGCASTAQGQKFDDSYVSQIKKNVTTKTQIRQAFGEPQTTSRSADMETWIYAYSDGYGRSYIQAATFGLVKEKKDDQMLMVTFRGDVVFDFSYTK